MKAFSALLTIVLPASGGQISCPNLICPELVSTGTDDDLITPDLCFKHDSQHPTQEMRAYSCDWYVQMGFSTLTGDVSCEFDAGAGKYAWPDEKTQNLDFITATSPA